jgi:predicted glycosyltransferase
LVKVWIDVLTPKQVLFFEPLVRKLESRGIKVLVTSRDFKEAADLIKQKKLGWKIVGLYGGGTLKGKLKAELDRNQKLLPIITRFGPDYALGSASPSMVRMAFGLGIPVLLHSNTPHADKTMRLAVPLAEHLFIPGHIPKHAFIHYGIHPDKITQYNAMDEIVWSQKLNSKLYLPNDIILVRLGETKATYHVKEFDSIKFLRDLSDGYPGRKIVVLPRYADERRSWIALRSLLVQGEP